MPTQKPKWLRRLERESWQAELIISGAAIFGASLLPGLLNRLEVWLLLNLDDHTLQIWHSILQYFAAAATLVIMVFIGHFVLRALWIGMVGLNSVFPGGLRRVERYSDYFQDRMQEDIGDIDGFILRLDRLSSGIFGAGFTLVSLLLNLGLIGSIFAVIYRVAYRMGADPELLDLIGLLLFASGLLLAAASAFIGQKRFHQNEWMTRLHYQLQKKSSWIFLVNRHFTTLGATLLSYTFIDRKGYFGYILLGSLGLAAVLALSDLGEDYRSAFNHNRYYRMGSDSTSLCRCNYADSDFDGIYYSPVIPAKIMDSDEVLSIFVPLPEREVDYAERGCTLPETDQDLPTEQRRAANRLRTLGCLTDYITVTLNDRPITADDVARTWRRTSVASQFGVEFTLLEPDYLRGRNLLSVTTQFPKNPSDATPRTTYVPFYVQ